MNRCKTDVGHINHSEFFIAKYCDYVGEELRQETINWEKTQNVLNVTLDIGTCTGVTMLAVLTISEKQIVKLVDIVPVTSKKGEYLANVLYDILQMQSKDSETQITQHKRI